MSFYVQKIERRWHNKIAWIMYESRELVVEVDKVTRIFYNHFSKISQEDNDLVISHLLDCVQP